MLRTGTSGHFKEYTSNSGLMTEDFLHFIWKTKMFNKELFSSDNEEIKLIKQGHHNKDGGPDFIDARIKIGKTTWAGNVEIHIHASDWYRHSHQQDAKYDNIILHVVFENDQQVKRTNGQAIPSLELKGKFDMGLYAYYLDIVGSDRWVPCQNMIADIPVFITDKMLERMIIDKFSEKSLFIKNALKKNRNNWEQTFYEQLARNFGFKVNAEAFELLAKSLPMKFLAKHKSNAFQLEALCFGQAGLLKEDFTEDYPKSLQQEYIHLRQKFNLVPIDEKLWQFLRLRPTNFPGIRISQFAALIGNSSHLFSKIISSKSLKEVRGFFEVAASEYWDKHFRFDHKARGKLVRKKIGKDSINLLLINTVIPFIFIYGDARANTKLKERAIDYLSQLTPEKNALIKNWRKTGITIRSALESQALLQLKKKYCNRKRCLECQIGNYLLKSFHG